MHRYQGASWIRGFRTTHRARTPFMRRLVPSFLSLVVCAFTLKAQAPKPVAAATAFTAEDALDITSYTVADLSSDGRWLAATSSVRRDGFGVDFRRDGDPTYIRPNAVRLWVFDTRSGERRAVFPEKRNVRAARWSPDGTRLAFLELRGETFVPVIWDRSNNRSAVVPVPAGKYVAENSDLRWTSDGTRLVFTLRANEWRKKARDVFA